MTPTPEADSRAPSQPEFDRIVARRPVGNDAPVRRAHGNAEAASRVSAISFWIGVGVLVVLAALAFWLLPHLVSKREPGTKPAPVADAAAPATEDATPAPPPAATEPAKPIWDDASALEMRAAAQAAQKRYEEQMAQLPSHGVDRWASPEVNAAKAQAESGGKAFAAKDFTTSRSSYESAATATAKLLSEVPQRLAAALVSGAQALEAGDKAAAQQSYELALALDAGNASAQRGLKRVGSLDAVRAKLETANTLEKSGDVAGARMAWQQALALDPETQPARDALARLDAQASEAEFQRAMGETLSALDRAQYDTAELRLSRARKLRPNDAAVQQATQRIAEARRAQKLVALEREAAAQSASEDWSGAVSSYRAALQLDSTVAFARDGLARTEPRAALTQQLQGFIDHPARLNSAAVAAEAERTLTQARALPAPGPRLGSQITALSNALGAASKPLTVQLRSDNQTEVTIYKIGPMGKFTTRDVQLKPGRYVAVGSRAGYVDVRREFDVAAGASRVELEIRCEERL